MGPVRLFRSISSSDIGLVAIFVTVMLKVGPPGVRDPAPSIDTSIGGFMLGRMKLSAARARK